jgi:hypothetical protein
MKRSILYIFIFFTLPVFAQYFEDSDFHSELEQKAFERLAQNKAIDPIMFFVTTDSELNLRDYQDMIMKMKSIPVELSSDRFDSFPEHKKVKKIFRQVQKKFFKRYQLYHTYGDLMKNGDYNCISGTAFFAILYGEMGYDVHIYETPFHTFLEIEVSDSQKYLIESTDPNYGFVDNMKKIEKRREEYALGEHLTFPQGLGSTEDVSSDGFVREISLQQLAGLQYYNSAVVKFNEGKYQEASLLLKKASYLYPSPRIIMLQMLSERFLITMN